MHQHIAGQERCRLISYLNDVDLSDGLLAGTISGAVIIGCSDHGWLPYVCSTPQANLLIFQNFGHQVLHAGIVESLIAGQVTDLIVYGHSNCEFNRLMADDNIHSPAVQQFINSNFYSVKNAVQQQLARCDWSDSEKIDALSKWRVLRELELVLDNVELRYKVERNQIRLHAWYLQSDGKLSVFDSAKGIFC